MASWKLSALFSALTWFASRLPSVVRPVPPSLRKSATASTLTSENAYRAAAAAPGLVTSGPAVVNPGVRLTGLPPIGSSIQYGLTGTARR